MTILSRLLESGFLQHSDLRRRLRINSAVTSGRCSLSLLCALTCTDAEETRAAAPTSWRCWISPATHSWHHGERRPGFLKLRPPVQRSSPSGGARNICLGGKEESLARMNSMNRHLEFKQKLKEQIFLNTFSLTIFGSKKKKTVILCGVLPPLTTMQLFPCLTSTMHFSFNQVLLELKLAYSKDRVTFTVDETPFLGHFEHHSSPLHQRMQMYWPAGTWLVD